MIKKDYWIKLGKIQSVVGGYNKDDHDEIAHNFLAKKYLDPLISYAGSLGINTFLYRTTLSKYPGMAVEGLIKQIMKQVDAEEIIGILGIDRAMFDALVDLREAMIYVQKHLKWIAIREMNVELYGLDYEKGQLLLRGLDRIFDREKLSGVGMVFTIFDHKTGRTMNVSYDDIVEGNFFKAGEIPAARSYGGLAPKNWRGTSEGVNLLGFAEWLEKR